MFHNQEKQDDEPRENPRSHANRSETPNDVLELMNKFPEYPQEENVGGHTLPSDRQLAIIGYSKNSAGIWVYEIQVTGSAGLLSQYVVKRRFNDFRRLHRELSKVTTLPELPAYGVLSYFRNSHPTLLEYRCQALQCILLAIQHCPLTRYSDEFAQFLGEQPFSKTQSGYISLNTYGSYNEFNRELQEIRKRKGSGKSIASAVSIPSSVTETTQPPDANDITYTLTA